MEAERVASYDYWLEPATEDEYPKVARSEPGLHQFSLAPTIEAEPVRREESAYLRSWKRALDLAIGLPLFVASVPLIAFAVTGVAISTGWPAFYKTKRMGIHGSEFTMWKIRTMVKDADQVLAAWRVSHPELAAEYDANFKLKNDPRITWLGRFLRRTSLDELPQFYNVLRGDMSLVGPRPYYSWELAVHPGTLEVITRVRPGVTGPWQVAGRNSLSPAERMFIDRTYVNTCKPGNDIRLLVRTVRTLLKPNGI